jgi:MFS transporter, LPLT family, lysophospholipid transporter
MNPPGRDYSLLLAGQFLGAFGDNFLLKAILGPLTYEFAAGRITEQRVGAENAIFSAVNFAPFILLAPLAGYLNDRMPKTSWLVGGNIIKIVGAGAGLAGSWMFSSAAGHAWQVAGYAIVGVGACVYSPAKYGILPEILPSERLVKANGMVEMLTLVAILTGIASGALLFDWIRSVPACYGVGMALYALALGFNGAMNRSPCNGTARLRRSVAEFGRNLGSLASHPRLGRILLGSGMFWFAGAVLRSNLQGWGLAVFRAAGVAKVTNFKLALLVVGLTLGVVAGSLLAGQLHKVGDLTRTRRYGFLLAISISALGLLGGRLGISVAVIALIAAGVFAGLLLVPLNAALQAESDRGKLGKTVSAQNFVDYLSMTLGAGFLGLLSRWNLTPALIFDSVAVVLLLFTLGLRIKPGSQPRL